MLHISLILSAVLLLIVNVFAWQRRHVLAKIIGACAVFWVGFAIVPFFPVVFLQSLLIALAALGWRYSRRGAFFFLLFSCAATLTAYVPAGIGIWKSQREYARLRSLYPYESMVARAPKSRKISGDEAPSAKSLARLSRLDDSVSQDLNGFREWQLMRLHEEAVELFINSPGFGAIRMIYTTEDSLKENLRESSVPNQPGVRLDEKWSPGELRALPTEADEALLGMLDQSILDFVYAKGFGYFKDRQHVAGFLTHRFSKVPKPVKSWKVQSIELVSLLTHDEPQVYVSTHLPAMDKMHDTPTRPLDRFESLALETLRHGEDLFSSQTGEGVRMLGAVRSGERCMLCHGSERGELLGAFSYRLR